MQKYKGKLGDLINQNRAEQKQKQAMSQRELDALSPNIQDSKVPARSLKIDNANSAYAKPQNIEAIKNIEEKVKEIIDDQKEMANLTLTLTQNIMKALNDKTLKENKTKEDKDIENNVINDYVKLARIVNVADNQEEGLGNLGFIYAIAKCLFVMRDRVNEIEYKNMLLSRVVDKQNIQIAALEASLKK